jgi:peroxiredoxin
VVRGVNTSDDRQIALEYLKENRVTFPNALDSSDAAVGRMLLNYETLAGMCAVPLTYLIDREGKVIDAWYDHNERRGKQALKKAGL